jgi:hypothetical protein
MTAIADRIAMKAAYAGIGRVSSLVVMSYVSDEDAGLDAEQK